MELLGRWGGVSMLHAEEPVLLITGGIDKNNDTLKDAWLLHVNSGKWREVREV